MTNKVWEGHERREHDDECKQRIRSLKEWVADKICIATKPTKGKLTLLIILLASTVTLSGVAVVNSLAVNGDAKHNKEEIQEVKEAHKALVGTVRDIEKTQARMDRNLSRLLGAMGVPVEVPVETE